MTGVGLEITILVILFLIGFAVGVLIIVSSLARRDDDRSGDGDAD